MGSWLRDSVRDGDSEQGNLSKSISSLTQSQYQSYKMTSFHKPKLYRSHDGCCICRAKSSSSRFTSSKKYEEHFPDCFKLSEVRAGEVCNACVLIVKRWKNLPDDTLKDWAHVVDARIGPGVKNVQRPKDQNEKTFPKIRRKNVARKTEAMESKAEPRAAADTPDIPEFLDTSYWTRCSRYCNNFLLVIQFLGRESVVALFTLASSTRWC